MKSLFRFMLIASVMLSASTVFADHAPPNQTADVSISCNIETPGNFANIEAASFSEVTALDIAVSVGTVYPVFNPAQNVIAVDSGQGYKRLTNTDNNSNKARGKCIEKPGRLHKPGTNL